MNDAEVVVEENERKLETLKEQKATLEIQKGDLEEIEKALNKLSDASKFYHISTGGGATLEFLSDNVLPGIDIINDKK